MSIVAVLLLFSLPDIFSSAYQMLPMSSAELCIILFSFKPVPSVASSSFVIVTDSLFLLQPLNTSYPIQSVKYSAGYSSY